MKLKEARNKCNLTQGELAKACNVGRTAIANIESGLNKPSVQLAKKMGEILRVDWTIFFD